MALNLWCEAKVSSKRDGEEVGEPGRGIIISKDGKVHSDEEGQVT